MQEREQEGEERTSCCRVESEVQLRVAKLVAVALAAAVSGWLASSLFVTHKQHFSHNSYNSYKIKNITTRLAHPAFAA